jgi:hypothetical protein
MGKNKHIAESINGAGLMKSNAGGAVTYVTDSSANWNTAYGWGNHATVGYLTTISGIAAGGELAGTYTNPTLVNSAVIGKALTGLNLVGGGTIANTDTILQAFGKIQNQISGLMGGVIYMGLWNATTNSPALTSSVGTKGNYYVVSVAGATALNGITDWKIGDWVIYNGTSWDKVDNTDAVSSVNGFVGAVSLTTANISEVTNLYYTDARARAAISITTTGTSGSATYNSTTGVLNIPVYNSMVYPAAGIPVSTGSAWGTSATGTANQIVYWGTSNILVGSSNHTWDNTSKVLTVVLDGAGYIKLINTGGNNGFIQSTNNNFLFSNNVKYNGSTWNYENTGYGAQFQVESLTGTARISTAVSGTAGAAAAMVPHFFISNVGRVSAGVNLPVDDGISSFSTDGILRVTFSTTNPAYLQAINSNTFLSNNIYHNGSAFIYGQGGFGALLVQETTNGTIYMATAVSGTAGAAATLNTHFSMVNAGRILMGITLPTDDGTSALQVTGTIRQTTIASTMVKVDATGRLVAAVSGTDYAAPGGAGTTTNSLVLKADTGTTEGTDLYTFNGASAKTLNIVAGTNMSISKVAGQWTINTSATTNVGTVTSVGGTGTVSGLTLSGTVTSSGNLTLGGTLSLTSGNVTTALGFTPYNSTNPSGYITGITGGMVTTALGYTPYNNTNPSGFITGITSGMVTTALGFTPYSNTNPSGYITGYTETDTLATVTGRGSVTSTNISLTASKLILSPGSYGASYNTVLGTRATADGVLQFGNNGTNYIVAGNSVAGGALYFYVNATTDFVTTTSGTMAMYFASNAVAFFQATVVAPSIIAGGGGTAISNAMVVTGGQAYQTEVSADPSGGYIQTYNRSSGNYQPFLIYGGSNTPGMQTNTFNSSGITTTGTITANYGATISGYESVFSGSVAMTGGWGRVMTLSASYPCLVFNSGATKWASINYDYSSAFIIRLNATSSDTMGTGYSALSINGSTGAATFSNTVTATAFINTSDARLKNEISRDGDMVYFKWITGDDDKVHAGYIAQEVAFIYPDQVTEDANGFLAVNYIEVHTQKIRTLEKRIAELETLLNPN